MTEDVVAAAPTWSTLGQQPGISDDGTVVAFAGTSGFGPGVFLYLGDPNQRIVPVVGRSSGDEVKPNLGVDKDGAPIYFETIDLNSRVAVLHEDAGTPGLAGDSILVSFVAKPNKAGGGFTDQMGIWTLRLTVDADDTTAIREVEVLPVFQVGGTLTIPGEPDAPVKVTDLIVYGQLAPLNSSDPAVGDHQLAFWAQGGGRQLVVKATHRRSAAP